MTPFLGCVLRTMDEEKAQASKTRERKDREECARYESINMKFYNRQSESVVNASELGMPLMRRGARILSWSNG